MRTLKGLRHPLPPFFLSILILTAFTSSELIHPINASSSPQASFTYTPPNPYVNGTVTFNASDSKPNDEYIDSYEWDFGDGEFGNGMTVTHAYDEARTYMVTLNVTNSEGLWSTLSKPVIVSPVYGPTASFTYSPPEPFANGTTTFDASSSTPGWNGTTNPPIVEYKWNFADGTPIVIESEPVTTHIYRAEGNYTVTLNVTDTMGWWNTTSQDIRVYKTGLDLTVTSDKLKYYIELDQVQIQGNLTFQENPVADCFIALEVDNPNNWPVVIRTLQTGTAPISEAINITDAFLCDQIGKPVDNFKKGAPLGYFYVATKNIGNETLSPLATLNFYQNSYPFLVEGGGIQNLHPGDPWSFLTTFTIPEWVTIGNVTVYINVFSDFPRSGGYPYCQEKIASFEIVDPSDPPTETTVSSLTTNENYNITFQVPPDAKCGNYTVNVSAYYADQLATSNTTFIVKLAGDADGDCRVGYKDFGLLAAAYGSEPEDPNWNPNCDFDGDNRIGYKDFGLLAAFYGREV